MQGPGQLWWAVLVAGPVLNFMGSPQPGSPNLTGTSVPRCVTGPEARTSSMLVGKTVVLAKLRQSRETQKSVCCG